jgi:tRNA threonylcarbamoyladenosine biosynthesis protein TsaE
MDLYRLEFEEIAELGIEDYISDKGVCVIEWAEKAGPLMPQERLSVNLSYLGELERELEIIPEGSRYEMISRQIAETLDSIGKGDS